MFECAVPIGAAPGSAPADPADWRITSPHKDRREPKGFDVRAADSEQGPGPAPGGELAQVQRVRLAGQAAVPGQEAGEGDSLGVSERRLDRGERGGWDGSGRRRLSDASLGLASQAGVAESAPPPSDAALTHGETRVLHYLPTNLSAREIAG